MDVNVTATTNNIQELYHHMASYQWSAIVPTHGRLPVFSNCIITWLASNGNNCIITWLASSGQQLYHHKTGYQWQTIVSPHGWLPVVNNCIITWLASSIISIQPTQDKLVANQLPPLMPNIGPCDGWRTQAKTFFSS